MTVFRTYMKRTFARPWNIAVTVAVPLLIVVLVGAGGGANEMRVALIDQDESVLSGMVRDAVEPVAVFIELEYEEITSALVDGRIDYALCAQQRPDVVLMDIRMPVLDGVEATSRIKARMPDVKVIVLTTFDDEDYIRGAMAAGAEGYLLKSSPADAIVESVRAVHRGTTVLQTEIARRLSSATDPSQRALKMGRPADADATSRLGLSPRESEILTLIAEGLSNKEIAGRLHLSDGTVRNYVSQMLVKLDVRDRTQLAILYYRSLG